MARLDWVRTRLENWARWCAQRESSALGYPRSTPFAKLGSNGGYGAVVPIMDLDASEIDDAVQSLRLTASHLHKVLILTYAKGLPRNQVALAMRRAESTVNANLCDADRAVARWLEVKKIQHHAKNSL